jgi:hypothetical protein
VLPGNKTTNEHLYIYSALVIGWTNNESHHIQCFIRSRRAIKFTNINNSFMYRGIISILTVLLWVSCDRPECRNTNDIFSQLTPDKEEYKKELATEMQRIGMRNLRYWLDKPIVVEGKQLVEIYIQGHGLCAKGQLFVADKAKKIGLGTYGGDGYHGAELKNVEITILQDSAGTDFILAQVGKILD